MDAKRRYCHGHRPSYDRSEWTVPVGKKPVDDTRCRHCTNLFAIEGSPYAAHGGSGVNCDSYADEKLCCVNYSEFQVRLSLSKDQSVPLFLLSDQREKTEHGVGVFALPTQTEYSIDIGCCGKAFDGNAWTHFAICSVDVGSEKVSINNGEKIMYRRSKGVCTRIQGFSTDGNRSFLFVSTSDFEKANAPDAVAAVGYNKGNIIKVVLQKYKEEKPKPVHHAQGLMRYDMLSRNENDVFPIDIFGGGSFGGGSRGGGADSDGVARLSGKLSYGGGPAVSGGNTVSGGTHVDAVRTVSTKSKFTPVGNPVTITLQLVCNQTQEEIQVDNLRSRLQKLGYDYMRNRAKLAKQFLLDSQDRVNQAETELKECQHLEDAISQDPEFQQVVSGLTPQQVEHKMPCIQTDSIRKAEQAGREQAQKRMLMDVN